MQTWHHRVTWDMHYSLATNEQRTMTDNKGTRWNTDAPAERTHSSNTRSIEEPTNNARDNEGPLENTRGGQTQTVGVKPTRLRHRNQTTRNSRGIITPFDAPARSVRTCWPGILRIVERMDRAEGTRTPRAINGITLLQAKQRRRMNDTGELLEPTYRCSSSLPWYATLEPTTP